MQMNLFMKVELEKVGENLHERSNEDAAPPKRYYFENLKISLPQVKLSVFTSHKLPPDLKVRRPAFNATNVHVKACKLQQEQVGRAVSEPVAAEGQIVSFEP